MDHELCTWSVEARNLPEHAGNPIHTDVGAQAAGFPSALVAGVTTYAYLTHPAVAAWGREWVEHGGGEVRFRAPVFAGDRVDCTPRLEGSAWHLDAVCPAQEQNPRATFAVVRDSGPPPAVRPGDVLPSRHAPSLPGYGFSGKPTEPGWGVEKIADVWAELMTRLGYDRFVAQGGDWGSAVTNAIAARHPDRCIAAHMTLAMSVRPSSEPTEPDELRAIERLTYYREHDSGYSTQQATRPQTLGYALADSPAGQAAWILEKFCAWTDCDGHPEHVLTRDELLDNVMLYWVTNSATSSARLYWESFGGRRQRQPVTIPVGFSVYPGEIVPPVRKWVEQVFSDVRYWAEHDRGGHFAAFEVPDSYVTDVRDCFREHR